MDPSTFPLSWTNQLLNKLEGDYKLTYSTPTGETKKISNEIKGALQRTAIRFPGSVGVIATGIADIIYELAIGIIKTADVLLTAIPDALRNSKPLLSDYNCTRTIIIQHFAQAGKHLATIVPLAIIVITFGPEKAAKALFNLENEVTTLTKSIVELEKEALELAKEKKRVSSKEEESKLEAASLTSNEETLTQMKTESRPVETQVSILNLQIQKKKKKIEDLKGELKATREDLKKANATNNAETVKEKDVTIQKLTTEIENLKNQLISATPPPKATGAPPPPPPVKGPPILRAPTPLQLHKKTNSPRQSNKTANPSELQDELKKLLLERQKKQASGATAT